MDIVVFLRSIVLGLSNYDHIIIFPYHNLFILYRKVQVNIFILDVIVTYRIPSVLIIT